MRVRSEKERGKAIHRQLVIVGDGACGKTCLMMVYACNQFPGKHIPTVFETYVKDVCVDGKKVELALWDTAGQETFDRLRVLAYPDSDVVLIAFSVDDPQSLENVKEKWLPEVQHYCFKVPFFLVACKKDLRHDPVVKANLQHRSLAPVSYEEGLQVSREIRAWGYVECSAKYYDNVDLVFQMAARATLRKQRPNCILL